MNFFILGIVLFIVLFIYFEVTTLINLYPWNDLSKYTKKEKVIEAVVNGLFICTGLVLFISTIKWLMIMSVIAMFIHLLSQLLTWWLPYLTGKHLKQFPKSLYETHFTNTIKVLPRIKDHIIPDAQHNVLQFLTLVTFITCFLALFN